MLDKLVFKNNKVYDILKNIALLLPFFIACYAEIGAIWDIPYTMEIETNELEEDENLPEEENREEE